MTRILRELSAEDVEVLYGNFRWLTAIFIYADDTSALPVFTDHEHDNLEYSFYLVLKWYSKNFK